MTKLQKDVQTADELLSVYQHLDATHVALGSV